MTKKALTVTRGANRFMIPFEMIIIETGQPWSNQRTDFSGQEELAASILANGIRKDIEVVKVRGEDKYILKDGERRYRAVEYLRSQGKGMDILFPAISHVAMAPDQALLTQLISNDGRAFGMMETANVFKGLAAYGWTPEQIQEKTGKSITHVNNLLLLASGTTKKLQDKITNGKISATTVIAELKKGKDSDTIMNQVDTLIENTATDGKAITKVTAKNLTDKPKDKKVAVSKLQGLYDEYNDSPDTNAKRVETLKALINWINGEINDSQLKIHFEKP